VSVDPLTSLTGEPYAYAADNPINHSDPTGLEAIPIPVVGPQDAGLCADPVTAAACVAAGGYATAEAGKSIVNAWAGNEAGDEGEAELHAKEAERERECGERNPAQDKNLSSGQIKKLKEAGFDPHEFKEGGQGTDLYVDREGDIYEANRRRRSWGAYGYQHQRTGIEVMADEAPPHVWISLTIMGDDFDPNELTARLGVVPTSHHRAGDPIVGDEGRWRQDRWRVTIGPRDTVQIDGMLDELMARMATGSERMKELCGELGLEATLTCAVEPVSAATPFVHFPPAVVQWAADQCVAIAVDIMLWRDDDQDRA
jgi:hypothetical protein